MVNTDSDENDFTLRVGLREDTEKLLKAAKLMAEEIENRGEEKTDRYRAGNGTFSNDKVIRAALKQFSTKEQKEKAGL